MRVEEQNCISSANKFSTTVCQFHRILPGNQEHFIHGIQRGFRILTKIEADTHVSVTATDQGFGQAYVLSHAYVSRGDVARRSPDSEEGPAERRRARSAADGEVAASPGTGSTRRVGEDAWAVAAAAARVTPDAGAGAGGGEGEEDDVDVGEELPPAAGEGAGPGRGGDGEAEEDVQEQLVGERAEVVVALPAPDASGAASGGGGALLAVEVHHAVAVHPASAGDHDGVAAVVRGCELFSWASENAEEGERKPLEIGQRRGNLQWRNAIWQSTNMAFLQNTLDNFSGTHFRPGIRPTATGILGDLLCRSIRHVRSLPRRQTRKLPNMPVAHCKCNLYSQHGDSLRNVDMHIYS
jgi:hypothetical protein